MRKLKTIGKVILSVIAGWVLTALMIVFLLCLKQKKQFVMLLLFAFVVQCVIMAVLFFL